MFLCSLCVHVVCVCVCLCVLSTRIFFPKDGVVDAVGYAAALLQAAVKMGEQP